MTGFPERRLLLTGASGFVGRHLDAALAETDWTVIRGTRDTERAALDGWTYLDVDQPESILPALEGCDAAVYLIHSIDEAGDYPEREGRAADAFQDAARQAGVKRIVYLGGVAPASSPSRHLLSRLNTGEILRSGPVPTIELRAGMIIGAGGSSWMMVRDLAARLPAMLLPKWLRFSSWPIWIEDVVVAIVRALDMPLKGSVWYDLPGPERMTHESLLTRVAKSMGKDPTIFGVPVITPTLSSYWIALVTRASLPLARELVQGLQSDLDPSGDVLWDVLGNEGPTEFQTAVYQALEDESFDIVPTTKLVHRIQTRVRSAV